MLKITEVDMEINCRTLVNGPSLFHDALKLVLNGEHRFHVKSKDKKFDLVYVLNNSLKPDIALLKDQMIVPPYYIYDENDVEKLYLDQINAFSGVMFDGLNEYSVVLTRIILKYTDKEVYFTDPRIQWFCEPNDRLHVVEELPDYKKLNALFCCENFFISSTSGEANKEGILFLFHNTFIWQWLTNQPLSKIKYVEISIGRTLGIGGVLSHFTRFKKAFEKKGWKTMLQGDSSRFSETMLKKYFNLSVENKDADETNTIYIYNVTPLIPADFFFKCSAKFDDSILSDDFKKELNTYADAIIGKKRMLGLLIRGTDYITTKMPGIRKMATADEMIPTIHEWMERDQYDGIFLATEDQDILDRMRAEFPKNLYAIAQRRNRVSDFKDVKIISDLEKQQRTGEEYEAALTDTTVNYFYGLYLLSLCESFICSGYCNGYEVVKSFNAGQFKKSYLFQVGVTGNKQ